MSLERIRELVAVPAHESIPVKSRWPGMVEVWSHLHVADGVEIHVEPGRAGLSPEQLRKFLREVMAAYENVSKGEEND